MTVTLPPFEKIHEPQPESKSDIFAQIWRRRRFFLFIFTLAFLPALGIAFFWPPVYYTSGNVEIGNQEPITSTASPAWIEKLGDPADLESQILIILSRRMLRLSMARPGVFDAVLQECRYLVSLGVLSGHGLDCENWKSDSDELMEHVQKRYSVHALGRSRILAIGYESPLPSVAFVMANALLVTYLEDQRAENAQRRDATSSWLLNEAKKQNPTAEPSSASSTQNELSFYQDLYDRAKDSESERRVLLTKGRLVSFAEVPTRPSFPKRLPLAAAAFTIAALIAFLATLRKDATDRTIRGTYDLESYTNTPVLAVFPAPRKQAGLSSASWLSQSQQQTACSSSARALYSQLALLKKTKASQRILVASSSDAEARAPISMTLACAAAEAGRKVLLIDCNLKRAPVCEALPATGLAGVLKGEAQPQQAVIDAPIAGVQVIEAGCADTDPVTLFFDGRFTELMNWSGQYDLVLLDVTASGALSNVIALAHYTDGVLWCARWGHSFKCGVKRVTHELRRHGTTVLGLAITMVDFRQLRRYERPRIASLDYQEAD